MKVVHLILLMIGLSACAAGEFGGSSALIPGASKNEEEPPPQSDEENETADEPVMVSGAWLTLGCSAVSDFSSLQEFAGFASVYQCGLYEASGALSSIKAEQPLCQNTKAQEVKTIDAADGAGFHFYLGLRTNPPTGISGTSCQVSAANQIVTFESVKELPAGQDTPPQQSQIETPKTVDQAKVFELTFNGDNCAAATIDEISRLAPTCTDCQCSQPGKVGNAMSFDGVSSSVKIEPNFQLPKYLAGEYNISFWFRSSQDPSPAAANAMMVFSNATSPTSTTALTIEICKAGNCAGRVVVKRNASGIMSNLTSVTNVADGNWHQIVVAYQNEMQTITVNGKQEVSAKSTPAPELAPNTYVIGADAAGNNQLHGFLDEFVMWKPSPP